MDEIKVLLDRYALTDPALDAGQFTNPDLQALYTQLVAQGNLSLGDALKVGAAIEEIDIRDLQTRMSQTDNADIQQVYTNLMNGSYNHLKAFTSVLLTQTGETYQPQYLSAEQYQTIIPAPQQWTRAMAVDKVRVADRVKADKVKVDRVRAWRQAEQRKPTSLARPPSTAQLSALTKWDSA